MNNKVPICLHREDYLCDAGDQKRIENPGDKREQKKNNDRWFYLVPDYGWNRSKIHRNTASYLKAPNSTGREFYYSCVYAGGIYVH